MKQSYNFSKALVKKYEKPWQFLIRCCLMFLTLTLFYCTANAQTKITVTGTVSDTTHVKLPGVTISVVGNSRLGTVTDGNGRFILDVDEGSVLRISFVGFKAQSFTVSAQNKIFNVALKEDKLLADEVVVTAFGKKERKEALVGSVTSIKPSELKIPASNLTAALAGQAAGIIAYQRSGQPGQDNASFFVRG